MAKITKSRMKKDMAVHFIRNHLQHIGLDQTEYYDIVEEEVLDEFSLSRVVAIVGAGASKSSGVSLGVEAIEKIVESVSMPEEMLKAELDRLTLAYRLPKDAFETTLMALSSNPHTASETREKLKELYDFRYIPSLCYEILAHLLKHRFIDAIINFNFDELLDQAIEDELDKEEYYYILSDGDCPDTSTPINPVLELPLYIKPHGTVGHPSTLRFTNEDYYKLPIGITNLIEKLIDTNHQLVLIVIGFDMQSFEFNKILENAPLGSVIYNLNIKETSLNSELEKCFDSHLLDVSKNKLSSEVDDLWEHIYSLFKDGFKPRIITQHRFISRLFESDKGSDVVLYKNYLPDYFLQRTIIEICLSSAKSKGIVNIGELSKDRSGKYYNRYKDVSKKRETFYQLCKSLGYYDFGYSREMLMLKKPKKNEETLIMRRNDFMKQAGTWFDKAQSRVGKIIQNLDSSMNYIHFKKPLVDLYNAEEVEIKITPEPLHTKIFRNPKNILTTSELSYLTYKMINQKKCEHIWIVAETGAWLTNPIIEKCIKEEKGKSCIFLIVADPFWVNPLKRIFGDLIEGIYKIPWWRHNRHMTILLDSNKKPISSIYFTRRQRNSHITPVMLGRYDTNIIVKAFNAYRAEAERIK